METEHNECPTCKQDWVADTDFGCEACGRPASEHIHVTSVCKILYQTRARESSLIVENQKLKALLEEKELFIQRITNWPYDNDSKIYS